MLLQEKIAGFAKLKKARLINELKIGRAFLFKRVYNKISTKEGRFSRIP
jgi:hypothetical protein